MKELYEYVLKSPNECSIQEIDKFYELVLEGGKVQSNGLKDRINNCVVLGFCIYNDIIIGVSAIKRPQESYIEKIIIKANLDRSVDEIDFEIGYSFTEQEHRKKGISTEIKSKLISWMKSYGGVLFSTTAITSSQKFLMDKGFNQFGDPYDGKNDKYLKYYELKM